jgi:hypothetical protein
MKSIKGLVKIYSDGILIEQGSNLVMDSALKVLTNAIANPGKYPINYIYAQYGSSSNFPENGGPYVTPSETDTVDDLSGANISIEQIPINTMYIDSSTPYANNRLNIIAYAKNNDNQVYIGYGIVSKTSSEEILIGRFAKAGELKVPGKNIMIHWQWILN